MNIKNILASLLIFILFSPGVVLAEGESVVIKAESHRKAALEENREALYMIGLEKESLTSDVGHLETKLIRMKAENTKLQTELDTLLTAEKNIRLEKMAVEENGQNLASVMRVFRKDMIGAI